MGEQVTGRRDPDSLMACLLGFLKPRVSLVSLSFLVTVVGKSVVSSSAVGGLRAGLYR